jgi:hypothetical protein
LTVSTSVWRSRSPHLIKLTTRSSHMKHQVALRQASPSRSSNPTKQKARGTNSIGMSFAVCHPQPAAVASCSLQDIRAAQGEEPFLVEKALTLAQAASSATRHCRESTSATAGVDTGTSQARRPRSKGCRNLPPRPPAGGGAGESKATSAVGWFAGGATRARDIGREAARRGRAPPYNCTPGRGGESRSCGEGDSALLRRGSCGESKEHRFAGSDERFVRFYSRRCDLGGAKRALRAGVPPCGARGKDRFRPSISHAVFRHHNC